MASGRKPPDRMRIQLSNSNQTCARHNQINSGGMTMAFVNEYIPAEDFKKYDFDKLNKRPKETSGTTPSDQWTIDREADIWLRKFYAESDHTAPQGGYTGVSVWDFYWKGTLMMVKVQEIASGGGYGKPRWARSKLLNIDITFEIENYRHQIISDLEAAFTAYRGAGVLAKNNGLEYSFSLEV
jgi:hypothetical protein